MSTRRRDFRGHMTTAERAAQEEVISVALPTEEDLEAALAALSNFLWEDDELLGYDGPEGIFEDFEGVPGVDSSDFRIYDSSDDSEDWIWSGAPNDWDEDDGLSDEEYAELWRAGADDSDEEPLYAFMEADSDEDLTSAGRELDLIPQAFLRGHPGLEEQF